MMLKTIAAILTEQQTSPAVLDTALALAAQHNAHVIGLHAAVVDAPPVMSPFDLPDSSVITALYDTAAKKREEIEALFNRAVIGSTIDSSEWRSFRGSSGLTIDGLVESARCVDMVVAPQPSSGGLGSLDDVLFEGARPILFVPWIAKTYKPFRRVVIAWDGSREAARAVFDAIAILSKAEEVEILTVDPKETRNQTPRFAGAEIAATLSRHGLKVALRTEESAGRPITAVIENRCSDFGADLLVMGAYSHPRLRERIFGGVTQGLLESMTVPVLMSR